MHVCKDDILKVNQYIYDNKTKFNFEVGEKIKEYRKQNNITMKEFADRSLMGINQINQIENGRNGITLSKFIILCNALEINPNILLEEFLYSSKINEDILYYSLQGHKNLSRNIVDFIIRKK